MNENIKLILKRLGIILVVLLFLSSVAVLFHTIYTKQLGSMIFALLFGGIGAGVSIVRRIPSLPEQKLISLSNSWWNLVTPILVGVVMGCVLYIVFFAGILTGDGGGGLFTSNLFPNFDNLAKGEEGVLDMQKVLAIRPSSIQDLGKLVIWCFLSGYSERLVPNLLESLEKRAVDGKG